MLLTHAAAKPTPLDQLFIGAGWILAVAGTGTVLLNATGWLWIPALGPHFLGVVIFLAIGALAFLIIVFRRLRTGPA